ncbi:MAG: ABC transporter permease [Oligoflexia bacterium]|nr:ABC transporter permease [Oligoflexia bacterium]
MLLAMAWRNLQRHGRRTFITAAAMGISVAFVMAMLAYVDGMYRKMADVMINQTTGQLQVAHPDFATQRTMYDTVPDAAARLKTVAALPGVRGASARLYGFALLGGAEQTAGAQLVGVLPEQELELVPMRDRMVSGAWLAPDQTDQIVLGEGLAETLEVAVGDQVVAVTQAADGSLGNALYQVVGVLTSGSVTLDRTGAWLRLKDLQTLLVLPDQAHEITLLSDSLDSRAGDPIVSALVKTVRAALPTDEKHPLSVRPWWVVSPATASMLATSDASAWLILVILFLVAGLGILNTMLMSVFERTKELGVMKALGTRPAKIVQLVLWESLLLSGLACLGGLVLGGVLDWMLVNWGLALTTSSGDRLSTGGVLFDPRIFGVVRADRIVVTVLTLLCVAVVAALWPAFRAARLRPVVAMRDE